MIELDENAIKKLSEPNIASLATVMPNGSPQVSYMWVHPEDGKIALNSAVGRQKDLNMRRDPRVALTVAESDNGYDKIEIRGRVIEVIEGDEAEAYIDFLAQKYIAQSPYPWRSPGERRVKYIVEPLTLSKMP
jgi:PPOX class probable F420-dependent enzyme